jgi:hypothetical protein
MDADGSPLIHPPGAFRGDARSPFDALIRIPLARKGEVSEDRAESHEPSNQ